MGPHGSSMLPKLPASPGGHTGGQSPIAAKSVDSFGGCRRPLPRGHRCDYHRVMIPDERAGNLREPESDSVF
jgi:hypothetical protein